MPSPFPGMDPYLEDSDIWPGFYHSLASEVAAQLNPPIGPRYYADVEVRTVAEEVSIATRRTIYPDAAILEQTQAEIGPQAGPVTATVAIPEAPVQRMVQVAGQTKLRAVRIYATETDQLVTSIEILSPFNKRHGEGLEAYRRKRTLLLQSPVHTLEIDLLRGGERPGREVGEPSLEAEYVLLVNRGGSGDYRLSEIWPVSLNDPLPLLPVPLLPPDPDVALDLGVPSRPFTPAPATIGVSTTTAPYLPPTCGPRWLPGLGSICRRLAQHLDLCWPRIANPKSRI